MGIYEMFGRQAEQLQAERDAHLKTLALLAEVAAGKIEPGRVKVDGGRWEVMASVPGPPSTD